MALSDSNTFIEPTAATTLATARTQFNNSLRSQAEPDYIDEILSFADEKEFDGNDQILKVVKNITSKGFIRSNYEDKLVDLSDVRINLKSKS